MTDVVRQLDILDHVRVAARKKILYLQHAARQMSRPDRMISTSDVRRVIRTGEVIEDYPEDPRGHSCLILGYARDRQPIHVVCAPKPEFLAIVTAYLPTEDEWENDFSKRKKQ